MRQVFEEETELLKEDKKFQENYLLHRRNPGTQGTGDTRTAHYLLLGPRAVVETVDTMV